MEINSKIHVEQLAPPGVHRQHSDKRDGQTDGQKNSIFLAALAAGEILHFQKLFRVRRTVSPLWGAENLAETQHHQLKTPHNSATP